PPVSGWSRPLPPCPPVPILDLSPSAPSRHGRHRQIPWQSPSCRELIRLWSPWALNRRPASSSLDTWLERSPFVQAGCQTQRRSLRRLTVQVLPSPTRLWRRLLFLVRRCPPRRNIDASR